MFCCVRSMPDAYVKEILLSVGALIRVAVACATQVSTSTHLMQILGEVVRFGLMIIVFTESYNHCHDASMPPSVPLAL
jgi:hypothetical protein